CHFTPLAIFEFLLTLLYNHSLSNPAYTNIIFLMLTVIGLSKPDAMPVLLLHPYLVSRYLNLS
ncbi:MAG: hypothetical protein ABS921_05280, partial [Psychrobacter alimentarius]